MTATPMARLDFNSTTRYADAAALNLKYRWIILIALTLGAIMEVLDTTIINVALPQMAGNLGATTEEIAWVTTAYILANVVILPITAFFTAYFGRRTYLTASIALFTVASFFCGTSHGLVEIVIWRLLQGAGGAALISTAQAGLVQVFPPKEQAIVQPLFLMGIVVAPTIGPTLGGFITDAASWNWCFFINVPLGIFAGFLVWTFLHDTERARPETPVDGFGIVLLTVGLAGLQYVLEEGQRNDWLADPTILHVSIAAGVALITMIWWFLTPLNKHPVINLHVLRNPSLTTGIIIFLSVGFGLYGVNYLYPVLAQQLQGLTSAQTGMSMLPGGLATAFSIVFCGVVSNDPKSKFDPRALTAFGIMLSVIGMFLFSQLNAGSGRQDTFWPLLIRGASLGFLMIPVNALSIASLAPSVVQEGVSLLGLARQLGGSVGTAILATYLTGQANVNRANLVNYVSSGRQVYTHTATQLAGNLSSHGYSAAAAHMGAVGMIDGMVNQQAYAVSYNQTFLLLMVVSIVMMPLVLLLKKPKAGAAAPAGMH